MLPYAYQTPAAFVLLAGGLLACFAGYRLFRVVLGIYGFILGAMLASSVMGESNTVGMVVAALVGGFLGALVLILAYFLGVALVGAGLGALVAHLLWVRTEPPAFAVVVLAVAGAIGATFLQRHVIIVGTAFAGAWTTLVGALALLGDRVARAAAASGEVWVFYPLNPAPGQRWVPIAWISLGIAGTFVQLLVTGRRKSARSK